MKWEEKIVQEVAAVQAQTPKKKVSYKDQKEFEELEKQISLLEKERKEIYARLSEPALGYDEVQTLTGRISTIVAAVEEKETRWLQLSEIVV